MCCSYRSAQNSEYYSNVYHRRKEISFQQILQSKKLKFKPGAKAVRKQRYRDRKNPKVPTQARSTNLLNPLLEVLVITAFNIARKQALLQDMFLCFIKQRTMWESKEST